MRQILLIPMLLFLAACGVEPSPPPSPEEQAKIDAAIEAISAEERVEDVFHDHRAPIEWHVGVLDDGTDRGGFASYLCNVLDEHEVPREGVLLRVVDVVKVVNQKQSFRDASLGMANCETFEIVNW